MANEPAIARVLIKKDDGATDFYYICRTGPIDGNKMASQGSPLGRMAALDPGDEFTFPNGKVVEIVEKIQFHPKRNDGVLDSFDTILKTNLFDVFTISNYLKPYLVGKSDENHHDFLTNILNSETAKKNIFNGIRRNVIVQMGIRDRPILDKYQDEIFRLPLSSQLLILGPPGTGKTTTLIKRLAQKTNIDYLNEEEKEQLNSLRSVESNSHSNSWLVFTPTELLKLSLKEAFARENIAASEDNLKTWQDYQKYLGKNKFGVLKSSSGIGGGAFILKNNLKSLSDSSFKDPIKWFNDFNAYQKSIYIEELNKAAQFLSENASTDSTNIGIKLKKTISSDLPSVFSSIIVFQNQVQTLINSLKEQTDKIVKDFINIQINKNNNLLKELVKLLDDLKKHTKIESDDNDDTTDDDDTIESDELIVTEKNITEKTAAETYMRVLRTHARSIASKRSLNKNSDNKKIIEWLGNERILSPAISMQLGELLLLQTNARNFINPVKRFFNSFSKRYRLFRKEISKKSYYENKLESRYISPLELDIILLGILDSAKHILSRDSIWHNIENPMWSELKNIVNIYKNQIMVDEATDFSPIQLACMASIAHPKVRSFFACGDFNQRLTTWGLQNEDEIKWIFPNINIKLVDVGYRQSQILNQFSNEIIKVIGGMERKTIFPKNTENSGFNPVLLENAIDKNDTAIWLAERIIEIEKNVSELPSIAILVHAESEVGETANLLKNLLEDNNIDVAACIEGKVIGNKTAVRVFDIQHIKGLEFEAVFFVSIDKLAVSSPALFEKYLYVGTTRAATYLGITCEKSLPYKIEELREYFTETW